MTIVFELNKYKKKQFAPFCAFTDSPVSKEVVPTRYYPTSPCGVCAGRLGPAGTAGGRLVRSADTHPVPSPERGRACSPDWSAAGSPPCRQGCRSLPPSRSDFRWASGRTNTGASLLSPGPAGSRIQSPHGYTRSFGLLCRHACKQTLRISFSHF